MASETFQLAILLSLKDMASGQLGAFTAKAHTATEQVKKDLAALDKTAREKAQTIAAALEKKVALTNKLSGQLAGVDKLNAAGLTSAQKRAGAVREALQSEAKELTSLSQLLRKSGKEEAAKQAEAFAGKLEAEGKTLATLGEKLGQIQSLRREGTTEALAKAKTLTAEVKEEARALDHLIGRLREVRNLRTGHATQDARAEALRQQLRERETLSERYAALQERMGRNAGLVGAGVAGLAVLWQGAKAAGDFQASMTDLRATLGKMDSAGKMDLTALNNDMAQAKKLAVELGNSLPGTTQDFVQMIAILKQNGIAAEDIFKGAGKAVAELSVANNIAPQEIAKDFARFGQLFQLKPAEYDKAADLFSRIYTATGVQSAELMQAMKYFQGRAGAGLGLTGLAGAQTATRMMAFLTKQGVGEGGDVGTSAFNFFKNLATQEKKLKALEKNKGIKLELFDDKGKFKGVANAIAEMEKLRKLSQKDLIEYGTAIAGDEGAAVLQAFVRQGADGWKNYNAQLDQATSKQEKVNAKSKDFNNQMESLKGTLDNLKVTAFEPLLPALTALTEKANSGVGALQQFGDAHPTITKTTAMTLAFGAAGLTAYGSIKMLIDGVRLWRTVSAISTGQGLIQALAGTTTAANTAAASMGTATTRANTLRGSLNAMPKAVQVTLLLAAVGMTIEQVLDLVKTLKEFDVANKGQQVAAGSNAQSYLRTQNVLAQTGQRRSSDDVRGEAHGQLVSIDMEGTLQDALKGGFGEVFRKAVNVGPDKLKVTDTESFMAKYMGWTLGPWRAEHRPFYGTSDEQKISLIQQRAPLLKQPEVMLAARQEVKGWNAPAESKQWFEDLLSRSFPQAFQQSSQLLAQQQAALAQQQAQQQAAFTQSLTGLQQGLSGLPQPLTEAQQGLTNLTQPLTQTQQSFQQLPQPVDQTRQAFAGLAPAATGATNALNNLNVQMANWQPPTPQVQTVTVGVPTQSGAAANPFFIPSKASGGRVERDGFVAVHRGEDIMPASVTTRWQGIAPELVQAVTRRSEASPQSAGPASVAVHYAPTITVNGGNAESRQAFAAQLAAHAREIESIVARQIQRGRERA